MRGRRLLWELYPPYLLITLLALLALAWFASSSVRRLYMDQAEGDLEARARLVRSRIAERFPRGAGLPGPASSVAVEVDSLCRALGRETDTRLTVILADGRVWGDSEEEPERMELHVGPGRPEIAAALRGEVGRSVRFSQTVGRQMLYVAVPLVAPEGSAGQVAAVVRAAWPLTAIRGALGRIHLQIVLAALALAVLLALVSLILARRITRPLDELRRGAARYAEGDLERALALPNLEGIRPLAETMNRMAEELHLRIGTISRQRNELEAILLSMVEGILAVDTEQTVVNLNAAGARMLNVEPEQASGKTIQEVVRNPELQMLIKRTLSSVEPVEGEVTVHNGRELTLQVNGTVLRDARGSEAGAVLALHDITHLRRLETMRRDFVANVSHELKTPTAAIMGAVETLEEGAIEQAADAERFLAILSRQASRLNAIIEDLLRLSRVEDEAALERLDTSLELVLSGALQACEPKAREKEIEVELACPPDLRARVNPALLENAVVNLIENAIKYSERGTRVMVAAVEHGGNVILSVTDEGCGIDKRFQARIFERFYRVDRARGRSMGGTGLGLAIVKHIARAHGGHVTVDSTPGEGSTFGIVLPSEGS